MLAAIQARLVADWRQAASWWSIRWAMIGAILLPLLQMVPDMPDAVQGIFPAAVRAILAGLWCIASIVSRLIAQKKHG